MSTLYFGKEIIGNPVLVNGAPVQWEPCGVDHGVIAFDDAANPTLAVGLTELADKRIGGVYKLSAEGYAEKKTQPPETKSVRSYFEPLRPIPQLPQRQESPKPPPAVAKAEEPAQRIPPAMSTDRLPNNALPAQKPQREASEQSLAHPDAPKFVPRTQRLAKPQPKEPAML